jgi:stage II sporulation protein D
LATTAAEARRRHLLAALVVAAGALSCTSSSTVTPTPAPEARPDSVAPPTEPVTPANAGASRQAAEPVTPANAGASRRANEPVVRVGLAVGVASARVGGAGALELVSASGASLGTIAAGREATVRQRGRDLALESGGRTIGPAATISVRPAMDGGFVRANGRDYRGTLALFVTDSGLTLVNEVPLESYLPGVVGAEMGARPEEDGEALEAQAIVSRTYAMRNSGRWQAQGFDYQAGVSDQVYAGIGGENPGALQAVAATAGLIVTWNGRPIDAFFFSTCGGRTEAGQAVFRGANPAYLRSVSDLAPDGTAYCKLSPRFHWREAYTGDALRAALRRYLPAAAGIPASRVTTVRDLRVTARTESGRAGTLAIVLPSGTVSVPGPAIRRALRRPNGEILRSTLFTLDVARVSDAVTGLIIEGSGAGHGVGFCQWGAVGRARAGQRHDEIIAAYFPGTQIERVY